jgi:CheY-like chemotaxis protein
MIRRNIELEARLIDDLLDVSRATCGRLRLDSRPVDAHDVINRALSVCDSEVRAAGLELHLELAASRHLIEADPERLQQLLWNLIKNAVKFTPRGGSIAIRTRNEADLADGSSGGRLIVEVADDGIGIEPAVLPRVFDAFEQGDLDLRRRSGGLGLGLAISRSVAEAHGGRLTAFSAGKGRGSTFALELATGPGPAHSSSDPPPSSAEPPGPQALRVLVVEDNRDTCRYLAHLLGRRSHAVWTASDLASARQLAATEAFDLLISDIELPDGSGLDLMRELGRACAMPGIAMSGFGSADDIQLSHEAGFAEHLTKPLDFRKLEAAIRQVTAGHGPAEAAPSTRSA